MTLQAANSLLKFLEEPQSPVVAILLTENGQAVLPTIRSRTQRVPFMPLIPHEMLQSLSRRVCRSCCTRCCSFGIGPRCLQGFIQQNGFAEMRNVVIQLGKDSLTRFTAAMISLPAARH